ncbi:lambda family phage portal protein [Paucimonas lemoignei]|uniref:Lambda family phage portal protein n=1 Tax=Paucimonas lemoignei TaxID=29443 RepID=A0A4R3HW29_PAULE|nr:phage portal protein [Paucimonas lemoignei]TCS37477.1 lambda family phage portal protein [Paucimonas lemoignei]
MAQKIKVNVMPNIVDKVVTYFDPVKGRQRLQARAQMALTGSYIGADKSRRSFRNWFTSGNSADDDLLPDLPTLREHSRDLMRNAPLAAGAVNTVVTNVVGTGLAMQARIDNQFLGLTDEEANQWQKNTEREYRLWCENRFECDATSTQNFYGMQDLVFRSALVNGDVVAVLPSRQLPGCAYGLKVQAVEGDRLATPPDLITSPNIFGGVEVDDFGATVALHIADRHPNALARVRGKVNFTRIVVRGEKSGRVNAIHLFRRTRPDQRRGEPYLAAVIEPLKQLDRYTEAEIMAAVISGMFTVFVEHAADEGAPAPIDGGSAPGSEPEIQLASGAIVDLEHGAKASIANPGRPNVAFDPFVMAVLRQIGVALELPFEVLIKHYTASYSAARAAMLEAWKFFKIRRMWLADNFCQPVYETWLAEAVATGRIAAPGFFADPAVRKAWCGAVWLGDGPGSIDPLKEANAVEKRIDIGLTTLAEEVAAFDGGDWETKHSQRTREHRMRREAGLLKLPSGIAAPPDPPSDNTDQ